MATTVKGWAEATKARFPREVASLQSRMTSGTTTAAEGLTVIYIGEEKALALVSWDFGHKEIVALSDPKNRHSGTYAIGRAKRRCGLPADLPNRLTGHALDEVIAAVSKADAVWSAVLAEEQAKERAERAEAEAQQNAAFVEAREKALRAERILAAWPEVAQALAVVLDEADPPRTAQPTLHDARQALRAALAKVEG